MLRGFRHTLFLILQIGIVGSAAVALMLFPTSWPSILICVAGAILTSLICERIAGRYLQRTLGGLRRLAHDIGRGHRVRPLEAIPGEDFYKLADAINLVAMRVAEATEKEEALQAQLRRSESLAVLGELAANVAHEVNNPLDGVQNCARILRRSLDDPQRVDQMLNLIDSGLARIELIVRRLLTLARHHVIRTQPTEVAEIIHAARAAVSQKLTAAGIQVITRLETSSTQAVIDAALMEQVFVNLIMNAVDSMSGGGEVVVVVDRESSDSGEMLRIDIADSGAGIPESSLPHIFEPFFTTKKAGKGTGLGLPIAARIVDAHHGSISVASRVGGGSVFTVRIPAAPPTVTSLTSEPDEAIAVP